MDVWEVLGYGLLIAVLAFAAGVIFSVRYTQYLLKHRKHVPRYLRDVNVKMPDAT